VNCLWLWSVVGEYLGLGHRVELIRQLSSSPLFSSRELVDYSNVEVFASHKHVFFVEISDFRNFSYSGGNNADI